MVVLKHQKGFTLVELMIVVAIIGVLAVTLLPALSGAQERARDGGRTASLNNISAALSTFNTDQGQYPTSATSTVGTQETGVIRCLSDSGGTTADDLGALLKGGKAPLDPQRATIVGSTAGTNSCNTGGVYAYYPLQKGGIDRASFLLAADMETYKKANFTYPASAVVPDGLGTSSTVNWEAVVKDKTAPLTAETSNKRDSVYVVTN